MSRRTCLTLVVAMLAGLIAMSIVRRELQPKQAEPIEVLVASVNRTMFPFDSITPESIESKTIPRSDNLQGEYFEWPDPEQVSGGELDAELHRLVTELGNYMVVSTLEAGEPLTVGKLRRKSGAHGLSGIVPYGKRAITLLGESLSTREFGSITPGDFVDVVVTYQQDRNSPGESETVLQAVKVLAVDQRTDPEREIHSVTLVVGPNEMAILEANRRAGTLTLAVRNGEDTEKVDSGVETRSFSDFVREGVERLQSHWPREARSKHRLGWREN